MKLETSNSFEFSNMDTKNYRSNVKKVNLKNSNFYKYNIVIFYLYQFRIGGNFVNMRYSQTKALYTKSNTINQNKEIHSVFGQSEKQQRLIQEKSQTAKYTVDFVQVTTIFSRNDFQKEIRGNITIRK